MLLGALGQHETVTRYEVRSGDTPESAAEHIRTALATGTLDVVQLAGRARTDVRRRIALT